MRIEKSVKMSMIRSDSSKSLVMSVVMSVTKILKSVIKEKLFIIANKRLRNYCSLLSYLNFETDDFAFMIDYIYNNNINNSNLNNNKLSLIFADMMKLVFYQHQVFKLLQINHLSENFERYWQLNIITKSIGEEQQQNTIQYQIDKNMKDLLLKHILFVNKTVSYLKLSYENCINSDIIEIDLFYRFIGTQQRDNNISKEN